jgi:TetR/AcrR family transcriptional regulator, ethionamide resistance regulator
VTRRTESPPRRAAVEAELMRAAEELLAEGNVYTELSIEQIAARAGISRSAFYFYFQDKRELLVRMVEQVAELFHAQADRWWKAVGDNGFADDVGPAELKRTLTAVLEIWREHAPLLAAIVETAGYDREVSAFWRAVMQRFVEPTRQHIEAEQAAGRAEKLPAEATAFALVWMTERVWYQHVLGSSGVSDEALIDALTGVIWCAVRRVQASEPPQPAQ